MTTFQFWNGLNTIGGNIVEVRTEKARVFCDFGLTGIGQTLEDTDGLSDSEYLIVNGYMPAIPGLYDTTDFQTLELSSYEESSLETAIFISHLHLDHMGLLKHLPETTTVYFSEATGKLYQTLIEVGEESASAVQRRTFADNETVMIGDIKVQPKPTDHDTIGACAFFIETPDLKLIHSGDVRLTGYHPGRVKKWTAEAAEWNPDILLLEGTTFSFEEEKKEGFDSETTLIEQWRQLLEQATDQLILFNPYIRNVERLKEIASTTEKSGRTFVFEETYAKLMHAFYPNEVWSVLAETATEITSIPYMQWISLAELQKHPEQFVLQNSFKNSDIVTKFEKGIYAHSNGEPLGDYDENYFVLLDKLTENQFTFVPFGVSGHAARDELIEIAKKVQAKFTVPWHSFKPEKMMQRFNEEGIPGFLPVKEMVYSALEYGHH